MLWKIIVDQYVPSGKNEEGIIGSLLFSMTWDFIMITKHNHHANLELTPKCSTIYQIDDECFENYNSFK